MVSPLRSDLGLLDGAAPALGEPALAKSPTIVLGVSAPDTRFLVGFEGVLETVLLDVAS